MPQKLGVAAKDLPDADLKRELRTLWRTREDTVRHGGAHAWRAHTDRMLELEHEFVTRFPIESAPSPGRTRKGSRAQSGQTPGRGATKAAPAKKKVAPAKKKAAPAKKKKAR